MLSLSEPRTNNTESILARLVNDTDTAIGKRSVPLIFSGRGLAVHRAPKQTVWGGLPIAGEAAVRGGSLCLLALL